MDEIYVAVKYDFSADHAFDCLTIIVNCFQEFPDESLFLVCDSNRPTLFLVGYHIAFYTSLCR